jgi:hypothetical protein
MLKRDWKSSEGKKPKILITLLIAVVVPSNLSSQIAGDDKMFMYPANK